MSKELAREMALPVSLRMHEVVSVEVDGKPYGTPVETVVHPPLFPQEVIADLLSHLEHVGYSEDYLDNFRGFDQESRWNTYMKFEQILHGENGKHYAAAIAEVVNYMMADSKFELNEVGRQYEDWNRVGTVVDIIGITRLIYAAHEGEDVYGESYSFTSGQPNPDGEFRKALIRGFYAIGENESVEKAHDMYDRLLGELDEMSGGYFGRFDVINTSLPSNHPGEWYMGDEEEEYDEELEEEDPEDWKEEDDEEEYED